MNISNRIVHVGEVIGAAKRAADKEVSDGLPTRPAANHRRWWRQAKSEEKRGSYETSGPARSFSPRTIKKHQGRFIHATVAAAAAAAAAAAVEMN